MYIMSVGRLGATQLLPSPGLAPWGCGAGPRPTVKVTTYITNVFICWLEIT